VILKLLNQDFPSPERIAWFTREYEVLRDLHLPGVVAAYSLEHDQQRPMMVLEDFGGESLHRLRLAGTLDLAGVLRLAIGVAEILGQVHQHYIMHKDINPSNIVLNVATGQVKLIDFGISTVLSRETPTFRNPNVLEGTLAYLSPEQTGRMNRDIDYRTDFYSFGVTLYELLTGRLPFGSDDPLELVHSHIAKLPPPLHASTPDLPLVISAIVLKLLAKNAEDRYQSAYGIVADMSECLRQWQASRRIKPFALGRSDRSDKLYIPQKLYAREQVRVTQPAGHIAILENDTLHQIVLPWPAELELAVRWAQFQALEAEYGVGAVDKFYVGRNLCGLFRECGITRREMHTFPIQRRAHGADPGYTTAGRMVSTVAPTCTGKCRHDRAAPDQR